RRVHVVPADLCPGFTFIGSTCGPWLAHRPFAPFRRLFSRARIHRRSRVQRDLQLPRHRRGRFHWKEKSRIRRLCEVVRPRRSIQNGGREADRLRAVRASAVGRPALPVPARLTRVHRLKIWLATSAERQYLMILGGLASGPESGPPFFENTHFQPPPTF